MEKTDITIIGAGAIGLAISYLLSDLQREITVIEKNSSFGQETSSRNSEVIHAGLYYPADSLKAKTCIRGRGLLYDFCERRGIAYKKSGKLIVAPRKQDIKKLDAIERNARNCKVKDLKFLTKKEIRKLEPNVKAESAIFSPESGIFDTHAFMQALFALAKEKNVDFAFSIEAKAIEKKKSSYKITVQEPKGEGFSFETNIVINCAGLEADKVAEFAGIDPEGARYKIHYCRGEYFRIRNPGKFSITHLVYPPPGDIDLGIHVTPDLAGGLRLGPDARYVSSVDYTLHEEEKGVFLKSVREFLPILEPDDIIPDTVGVRPKLQKEGEGFRDFVIREEKDKHLPNFINLIGIESPGLTSSLAIAEIVKDIVC
jgi:L-2-hydroxyglutarate oxidase LhgO